MDAAGRYVGGIAPARPRPPWFAASRAAVARVGGTPALVKPGAGTTLHFGGRLGSGRGGVDAVEAALETLGGGSIRVVATGGWGESWSRDTRLRGVELDPVLVHRGIERWARSA